MKPGVKYRVRFINMSAFSRYYVWMDGDYDLEVVEIDGVTLKPGQRKTRGIELSSGQRVSVIASLETLNQFRRIMVSLLSSVLEIHH